MADEPTDDFERWLFETVRRELPHPLSPGYYVSLDAFRYPQTLTAEQAVRLADRLVRLAGVGRVEMTEGGEP